MARTQGAETQGNKPIGISAVSFGIPFSCTNQKQQQLSSTDLQNLPYKTLAEVAELIRTKKISSEALTQINA
jgi:hypothetical protein